MTVYARHSRGEGAQRGRDVAGPGDAAARRGAGLRHCVLVFVFVACVLGLVGCSGASGPGGSAGASATTAVQDAPATTSSDGAAAAQGGSGTAATTQSASSAAVERGGSGSAAALEWRVDGVDETVEVEEGQYYYDVEHVVTYLELYGGLPGNYITKKEARSLGWQGGSVQRYLEGAAIGGDSFSNREGILPTGSGVKYHECDIDTDGASSRGAKRLIYSSDGRYYYSEDHYESFVEYVVAGGVVTEAE